MVIAVPTYVSVVSSSTGYIKINSKTQSTPNQPVQAGGTVNLYFADVTWSGSKFYLVMSYDSNPEVSVGDVIYSPMISVADVTNQAGTQSYSSGLGSWIVGNNWVNGSIAPNIPVGSYTIKAFDNLGEDAAVTDAFINVYSVTTDATLQVFPLSGPGGIDVSITGSGYPISSVVTIAYYDPAFGSWNFLGSTTSDGTGSIAFITEVPDLRKAGSMGDYPESYVQVSYRSEINGIVYAYADYNQYSRGLKTVGTQTANGLYGNGTSFASSIKVKAGETLTISGKYFHPGVIYVRWDGVAVVGTVTSNEWAYAQIIGTTTADQQTGSFSTTVTIPTASAGEHYIAVEDSESRLMFKISTYQALLTVSPLSGPGGVSVTFAGSGYPASSQITLSYLDPMFSTWSLLGTTTSDESGQITFTTEMPDMRAAIGYAGDTSPDYEKLSFRSEQAGIVYGFAEYIQYARGLKIVGTQTANGLYGNGTNFASTIIVNPGDTLMIAGQYFHPGVVYVRWDGVPIVGTVTKNEWANAQIIGTTTASQLTGYFETSVTIPTAAAGNHFMSIEDSETNFIIIVAMNGTTTEPEPGKTATGISISTSCSSTVTGFEVEISGTLFDVYGNKIQGQTVMLYYAAQGASTWTPITSGQTNINGVYSAVWVPPSTGLFTIKVDWAGTETYSMSSNTAAINSITYDNEYVFSVESNSTISDLAFNSTDRTLTFTAQGETGTQGYAKVIISKTLVDDPASITILLDGNQMDYSLTSTDDSWCLIIDYQHSTHQFVVDLNVNAIPEFTSGIIMLGIFIVATIALITYTKTAKRKKGEIRP
ncbi:MAG: hypothetical protein NWF03_05740 [Candidatus Bathyarchaeota archaeon]|nr:hypothetical protein [Candidatus Bathyarchaeota archaeon]